MLSYKYFRLFHIVVLRFVAVRHLQALNKKENTRDQGNQEDWSAIGHGSGGFMCVWGRDQAENPLFTTE